MMEVCIKVSHANLWQKDIVYDRQRAVPSSTAWLYSQTTKANVKDCLWLLSLKTVKFQDRQLLKQCAIQALRICIA